MEGMIHLKNSLKQFFRQPLRALLFLLLLTLVGTFLCLCAGLWSTAQNNIARAEEDFATIAVPNMAALRDYAGAQNVIFDSYRLRLSFQAINAQDEAQKILSDVIPQVRETGLSSSIAAPDARRLLMAYGGDISAVREEFYSETMVFTELPYNRVAYIGTCQDVALAELSIERIRGDHEENYAIGPQANYDRGIGLIDPEADAEIQYFYRASFSYEDVIAVNGEVMYQPDWIFVQDSNVYRQDELPASPPFEAGKRYLIIGQLGDNPGLAWGGIRADGSLMPKGFATEDTFNNAALVNSINLLPVQTNVYFSKMSLTYSDFLLDHPISHDQVRVEVSGTLEDFLADPQNAYWKQAIEEINITNHSVEVLTTDNFQTLYPFHQNTLNITKGRAFSIEEAAQGLPVCVISDTLAKANGLTVGDFIPLEFYSGRFQSRRYGGGGYDNLFAPARPMPYDASLERTPAAEYEIIGIYSGTPWSLTDYGIPANTIIVPDLAVPQVTDVPSPYVDAERDIPATILYTLTLPNKDIDAFYEEMGGKEFGRMIRILDQGYSSVIPGLLVIRNNAALLLGVGVIAWIAIVVLFLLIFVLRQRKEAGIMLSMGAGRSRTIRGLMAGVTLIIVLATLLSIGAGYALEDTMTNLVLDAPTIETLHTGAYSNLPVMEENAEDKSARLRAALQPEHISVVLAITACVQGLLLLGASWICARKMTKKSPLELVRNREGIT